MPSAQGGRLNVIGAPGRFCHTAIGLWQAIRQRRIPPLMGLAWVFFLWIFLAPALKLRLDAFRLIFWRFRMSISSRMKGLRPFNYLRVLSHYCT